MTPIEAAQRLLVSEGATVHFETERWKDTDDSEILFVAEGRVDPADGRGDLTYDFTTFFNVPGTPVTSPDPDYLYQVRWDAANTYFYTLSTADEGWGHMSRSDARERAGIIGPMVVEVLGIVALVAHADPGGVVAATPAEYDGVDAERFILTIGVADAVAEGVPAGVVAPDAFVGTYGVDTVSLEVWLVDADLRRIRYTLAREKALYGGPDRTQVTYDWEPGSPIEIEIPPQGEIIER